MSTRRLCTVAFCLLQIFLVLLDLGCSDDATLIPRSCDHLKRDGQTENGYYPVDPDGSGDLEPFTVHCEDMDSEQRGVTIVHHDQENREAVDGRMAPGTRVINVTYTASMEQIEALVRLSAECEQYIAYDCFESPLFSCPYRHAQCEQHTAWYSRQNTRMINWAGAEGQTGMCACGVTDTCDNGNKRCNCDIDDKQWRQDGGYIRDMENLPVSRLVFGASRDVLMYNEQGYYTIGALRCTGQAADNRYPLSCAEVVSRGWQGSGSYVIDPDGPGTGVEPLTVTCDFDQEAITIVHHNREDLTHVDGHERPLSYNVEVSYAASMQQIQALMAVSESCEQRLEYHCYGSAIFHPENEYTSEQHHAAWFSGEGGTKMAYWPGAEGHPGKCACGVQGSCDNGNPRCNCDNNDGVWRQDGGTITDKGLLPVTRLAFGDTSIKLCYNENNKAMSLLNEQGFYLLSPLRCRQAVPLGVPVAPQAPTADHLNDGTEPRRGEVDGNQKDENMVEPSDIDIGDRNEDKQTFNVQRPEDVPNAEAKPSKDHLGGAVEKTSAQDNGMQHEETVETPDVGKTSVTDQPSKNVPDPVLQEAMVDDIGNNARDRNDAGGELARTPAPLLHAEGASPKPVHVETRPGLVDEDAGNVSEGRGLDNSETVNQEEAANLSEEKTDEPLEKLQNPAALGQDESLPGNVAVMQGSEVPHNEGFSDELQGDTSSFELTLEVGIPVVLTVLAVGFVCAMKTPWKRMPARKRSRSDDFSAGALEFPGEKLKEKKVFRPRLLHSLSIQEM